MGAEMPEWNSRDGGEAASACVAKIALRLERGESLTAPIIAHQYRVGIRTAQRWIAVINRCVLPLERTETGWRRG